MNKTFLLIFLLLFVSICKGQKYNVPNWVDAAVKLGYGTSFLMNKNIMHDIDISVNHINYSINYGTRFGVSYSRNWHFSLETDGCNFGQKYGFRRAGIGQDLVYSKKIDFKTFEISLLTKYIFYNGLYLEFGPKYNFIFKVKVDNTFDDNIEQDIESARFADLSDEDYRSYAGFTAGVGLIVWSTKDDKLRVNFGIRINAGITEFLNDAQKPPVKDGVFEYNPDYNLNYRTLVNTNVFNGQAVVEIQYFFGYFAKSGCGKWKYSFF